MPLQPKTRLGPYEISAPIGAGGMGEVYRARDTKLGREVAIKVLPEAVVACGDRLARFEREARVLASLNHPNVATLHSFEEAEGTRFLVMELVEGLDLADRLRSGAIPVEEAIPIFVQIAEGLEAAHEKGILHRDLKPANIKLGDDGRVKILDFGLAKAMAPSDPSDPALAEAPTVTYQDSAATEQGQVLGTVAYMSPEQACGKPVDRRTDIWSFGVCLYEALAGRRAFAADDPSETLAAVLRDDVDFGALPAVPRELDRLLRRCLARDPSRRLRDVGDARLELESIVAEGSTNSISGGSVPPPGRRLSDLRGDSPWRGWRRASCSVHSRCGSASVRSRLESPCSRRLGASRSTSLRSSRLHPPPTSRGRATWRSLRTGGGWCTSRNGQASFCVGWTISRPGPSGEPRGRTNRSSRPTANGWDTSRSTGCTRCAWTAARHSSSPTRAS